MLPQKHDSKVLKKRLIVVSLCVIVGLLLVAFLAAPWAIDRNVRKLFAAIESSLELRIEVGDVEYQRFDTVLISDLKVWPTSVESDRPLVHIDRITANIHVMRLFSGSARIMKLRIENPRLELIRDSHGADNFAVVKKKLMAFIEQAQGESAGRLGSGFWSALDRHVPEVEIVGGEIIVRDSTAKHTLIPSELPETLRLTHLSATVTNTSVVAEELQISANAAAKVPFLGSAATALMTYDRSSSSLTLNVKLVEPIELRFASEVLKASQAVWNLGGRIRLLDFSVGKAFTAEEVAVSFAETPAVERISGVEDPPGFLAGRIQKLVVVRPTFEPAQDSRIGRLLSRLLALLSPQSHDVGNRDFPRERKDRSGQNVRAAITNTFAAIARGVPRAAAALRGFAANFPLPEVKIRLARLKLGKEHPWAAALENLDRINLDVTRHEGELVTINLGFGATASSSALDLSLRVHTATGETQVTLDSPRFSLHRIRELLPASVLTTTTTTLEETKLRLLYNPTSGTLDIDGQLGVSGLGVHLSLLATDSMMGIQGAASLHIHLDLAKKTLALTDTQLALGQLPVNLVLSAWNLADAPKMEWKLSVPRLPAQRVIESLPAGFLGKLEGLELRGDLEWVLSGFLDTADMNSLSYTSVPKATNFAVIDLGRHVDFSVVNRPFTHRVQEGGTRVREWVTGPGSRRWVPYRRISTLMEKVLTTTEDGSFWRHKGIAFFAIRDALVDDLNRGRFHRGGSTLTMQLVKNLFLIREKTISRKLQEMFLAWRIEQYLTKTRILELYLNIVELGPGIYGVGRAARHYFGKKASELNLAECLFLGSILPNPRRQYRHFQRGKLSDGFRKGLAKMARTMLKRDKITEAEFRAASPFSLRFRDWKKRPKKEKEENE
jgi:hypothetical protein